MESNIQICKPSELFRPDLSVDPLLRFTGEGIAQQFFWKAETDTIQTYEHRLTCRYLHIDRITGQFYNQERVPISLEAALDHALPLFQTTPWQMIWVTVNREPNLLPYLRYSDEQETRSPFRVFGLLRELWAGTSEKFRFQAAGPYADAGPSRRLTEAGETGLRLQARDLRLTDFTRRVA